MSLHLIVKSSVSIDIRSIQTVLILLLLYHCAILLLLCLKTSCIVAIEVCFSRLPFKFNDDVTIVRVVLYVAKFVLFDLILFKEKAFVFLFFFAHVSIKSGFKLNGRGDTSL